ncbi:hypothetical protein [Actinoplanes sp. N902-109]|uniref:hypothetical protein n=1 Tax=Actinoplanes sp. (strain N902-109) TaxID=649831 RepID=UPI0003296590|nr:hypothetical protein [Actinoplanes sp. N902-109]AGL18439.1 hypothetical protein L083_4929 [Actinoplanes sp. N902-109]
MISVADALAPLDDLADWLPDRLEWLPAPARGHLVVPLVAVAVIVGTRVVVHRLLPWAALRLLIPATAVVTAAVAAVALTVDFLLARLFRIFWLPLTGMHFALGDLVVAGTRGLRRAADTGIRRAGARLARFSSVLLLVAAIGITAGWNAGYCDRHPGAGCAEPVGQWWDGVVAGLRSLR